MLQYVTLQYSTVHYTTAAFSTLSSSKIEEVSQNSFVFKVADRQIDGSKTTTTTTTALITLHYNYNYNCTTSHYIQQLWVRWPLQTLQPVQETQLRPPFGPSVDSLCHPWFTTIHLSYRFPIFETSATGLCGTTGTAYMHHDLHWDWQSFSNVADLSIASRLKVKVSIWSKMREAVKLWQTQLRDIMVKTYSGLWKQNWGWPGRAEFLLFFLILVSRNGAQVHLIFSGCLLSLNAPIKTSCTWNQSLNHLCGLFYTYESF